MAFVEFKTNPLYVQGPDALTEIRRYTYHLGHKVLVVTACGPLTEDVVAKMTKSFESSMYESMQLDKPNIYARYARAIPFVKKYDAENIKTEYQFMDCEGWQVTDSNSAKIAEKYRAMGAEVIVGVGGGKALDLVREVHHLTGARVVLCPTAAASNAAATVLSVVYNEEGSEIIRGGMMEWHPDVVLVDVNCVIKAPAKTLIAGIGDCMSSYYEGVVAMHERSARKTIVDGSWYAHEIQKKVFYESGYMAVKSAETQITSPAFESVLAQILHMNGLMSPAVSMHLSHILDEILICFEPCRNVPHGFLVGYGVIPMLLYANFPKEEIFEYVDFCLSIGLPVNFKQLGIDKIPLSEIYETCAVGPKSGTAAMTPAKLTQDDFFNSMVLADKLVTDYLESKK